MTRTMLVICPTSQAKPLRHVGTTGKSVALSEIVSSDEQLLRARRLQSLTRPELKNSVDRLRMTSEAFGVSSASRAHSNALTDGNAGR